MASALDRRFQHADGTDLRRALRWISDYLSTWKSVLTDRTQGPRGEQMNAKFTRRRLRNSTAEQTARRLLS